MKQIVHHRLWQVINEDQKQERSKSCAFGMPDINHFVLKLDTLLSVCEKKDESQSKVLPENPRFDSLNNRPEIDTRS